MITIGLVRIGNDPVLRFTADNQPVIDLSLAYDYGRKGQDGKYPTQWVKASLWGKRAESLAPYLTKGQKLLVHLTDMFVEQYEKKGGGQGVQLRGKVSELFFAGDKGEAKQDEPKPAQSFDELSDDIPF